MIAHRYTAPPALKGIAVPGLAHEVTADGDDWVARCGERFSRKADGAVHPSPPVYRGEVCVACQEAAP